MKNKLSSSKILGVRGMERISRPIPRPGLTGFGSALEFFRTSSLLFCRTHRGSGTCYADASRIVPWKSLDQWDFLVKLAGAFDGASHIPFLCIKIHVLT